jgi:uncharacterized protein (TIGR02646 family)
MSKKKRRQVYQKFGGRCAYCGSSLSIEAFHVDHIEPKCVSGSNDLSNLFPSCGACNVCKGPLGVEQFRSKLVYTAIDPGSTVATLLRVSGQELSASAMFYFER